jgi:hypothetical protein
MTISAAAAAGADHKYSTATDCERAHHHELNRVYFFVNLKDNQQVLVWPLTEHLHTLIAHRGYGACVIQSGGGHATIGRPQNAGDGHKTKVLAITFASLTELWEWIRSQPIHALWKTQSNIDQDTYLLSRYRA